MARVSWARVVDTAGGAGPRGGGVEGVLVVCGTLALVGVVVGAGGGGIRDGVVRCRVPCGVGGSWGLAVLGRGGDVAGGGRCSMGAFGGRGVEGRGRGGGVGGAMSPGSARMVVLAWCGRVRAVVADCAAGFGCCGTVVVAGAGGGGAVGAPRGSGRGVVRCGLTGALVGASCPSGGRAGAPPDLSWSSWPGGCRGRVNPAVPVGATGSGRASGVPLGGSSQGL